MAPDDEPVTDQTTPSKTNGTSTALLRRRATRRAVKHGEFTEEVATAHSRDHKLLVIWRSDRHRHFPVKNQIHRACGIAVAEKDFPCLVVATSTQTRELYAALRVERREDRYVGEEVSIIHERTSSDFFPLTDQLLPTVVGWRSQSSSETPSGRDPGSCSPG